MVQYDGLSQLAVLSDTHGLLRDTVIERLQGVQVILHAGDVGKPLVLEQLGEIAPTYAVKGNVDHGEWASKLPFDVHLSLNGQRCYMVHRRQDLAQAVLDSGLDVIIFGHSHKPYLGKHENTLLLNPGSIGPRRFTLPVSMVLMFWEADTWRPEFVELET